MRELLTDLTFEEWRVYVFDHPITERAWYWDEEAPWWNCPAADTVQFLTTAFEKAALMFEPYSDAQVSQGLWFIADNACSNHMFALLDVSVPWSERQRCIRSIHNLFEQCFAKRCTPQLGHLSEPEAYTLNTTCYMWWDLVPLIGEPDNPKRRELDREILNVMQATLQINSDACRESALHGLGHWQRYYPSQVTSIINSFLQTHTDIREALQIYAASAQQGCVL